MKTKQDEKHDNGMNPGVAAVAGAVVGASIAAAGAVAMKDKKNRDKVKAVFDAVKSQAVEYADDAKTTAEEKVSDVKEKLQGDSKNSKK